MPLYSNLSEEAWEKKISLFYNYYYSCSLCPRQCKINRKDKPGTCGSTDSLKIASFNLHFGEEPPISGSKGSGTVFFSGCTLKCVYCQNYPLSQFGHGEYYEPEQLARIFLNLEKKGAHNINFVSPTPYLYQIMISLRLACRQGLSIPIVYNSSGYEREEIIKALEGVIDIYMPDFKYTDNRLSWKLSGVKDYYRNAIGSIREMYRQVGMLITDQFNIALQGTIIRHLILPGYTNNSKKALKVLADLKLNNCYLSLMSQYFPAYKAADYPQVSRRVNPAEYNEVKEVAQQLNFSNGWFQDI